MIEIDRAGAGAEGDGGGIYRAARAVAAVGADVQGSSRTGLRCDADARCGDRSVIRHGEAACASSTDKEIRAIRPRAPAHAHRAVAADLITHIAIDTRHTSCAVDREAACAETADNEI